jgi:putative membrane protein
MGEKSRVNTEVSNASGKSRPELQRKDTDIDFDDYFVCALYEVFFKSRANNPKVGPRDLDHHSKWPIFLRLHGSITPVMILPLLFVASWSTAITCISKFVHDRACHLTTQPNH